MEDEQLLRDAFRLGYVLRGIEDRLARMEASQRRIEHKIDALASGMTPAEIAEAVKKINVDATKINQAADTTNAAATTLDKQGA